MHLLVTSVPPLVPIRPRLARCERPLWGPEVYCMVQGAAQQRSKPLGPCFCPNPVFSSHSHPYPFSVRFQMPTRLLQLSNLNVKTCRNASACLLSGTWSDKIQATLPCPPSPASMKTLLLIESCSNASFVSLPTYREHSLPPESALSSPEEEERTVTQTDPETVFYAPRRVIP